MFTLYETVFSVQLSHQSCTNCTLMSLLVSALNATVLLSTHWSDHCTLMKKVDVQCLYTYAAPAVLAVAFVDDFLL